MNSKYTKDTFPKQWSVLGGEPLIEFFKEEVVKTNLTGNARQYYNFNGVEIERDQTERALYPVVTVEELREHYLSPEIAPIPEFWQIHRTRNTANIINEWMNKHHARKHAYQSYSDAQGYANNKNLHKIKENDLPEITFEQFQKYVLNQTQNMEKKIIGYKAPQDLFQGKVKKGMLYIPGRDGYPQPTLEDGFVYKCKEVAGVIYHLPKEIVESWTPVYEEEFKVGDWVVELWKETPYKDVAFQVTKIEDGKLHYNRSAGAHAPISSFRKATPEEIEKAQAITIGTFKADFSERGDVKFGCQRFTKEALENLLKTLFRPDFKTELKIEGVEITKDVLTKLINRIK